MKIIDLTMDIDEKTPVFPGDPKQEIKQFATIEKNGWNEKRLAFNSHFGTHIDAPFHMIEKGKKLTDYPIEKFIGEAVVIDARGQKEIDADLGKIRKDDIVFFFTGHSDDYVSDWPVISEKLAKELIRKKARIVGVDMPSPDKSPFGIHKLLFRQDILIIENLVNLKQLAGKRFECFIMPLKIKDADGAPCRVFARLG